MAVEEYKSNQYPTRVRFDDGVLERIHDSEYWKETCSTVTPHNVFDVANQLTFVGGAYAKSNEVAPFLCLLAKMLRMEPEIEKVIGCIDNPSSSVYSKALCAVYVRLTCDPVQCYLNLEKFHEDQTPVNKLCRDGKTKTCYMFNITDFLIRDDSFFSLSVQRLPNKIDLEKQEPFPESSISSTDFHGFFTEDRTIPNKGMEDVAADLEAAYGTEDDGDSRFDDDDLRANLARLDRRDVGAPLYDLCFDNENGDYDPEEPFDVLPVGFEDDGEMIFVTVPGYDRVDIDEYFRRNRFHHHAHDDDDDGDDDDNDFSDGDDDDDDEEEEGEEDDVD